jgi:flagellar motor switch protein FliN/FliY
MTMPEPESPAPGALLDLGSFHVLRDVEVEITVEIGRTRRKIADILRVAPGQTIELGKNAGEPVDIYVNGQLLGRGEAVVLGDRYGVRITELTATGGGKP